MKTGGKAHKRGQVVGTLVATIGSFSLGTVLAWPAPALPQLAKEHGISQAYRFPRYLVTNLVTNSSPNMVIHHIR